MKNIVKKALVAVLKILTSAILGLTVGLALSILILLSVDNYSFNKCVKVCKKYRPAEECENLAECYEEDFTV